VSGTSHQVIRYHHPWNRANPIYETPPGSGAPASVGKPWAVSPKVWSISRQMPPRQFCFPLAVLWSRPKRRS